MKIDAVGITTSNMKRTIKFYSQLGFDFSEVDTSSGHIEPKTPVGSARLMIDDYRIVESIIGQEPKPANHSPFAINYDTVEELDKIMEDLENAKFSIIKPAWNADWGQRYAVVEDPDGYRVDLYVNLD
jgi:uncharacterized glyoxalase superfamily protein PhnB